MSDIVHAKFFNASPLAKFFQMLLNKPEFCSLLGIAYLTVNRA